MFEPATRAEPIFIWKDFYFFMWHQLFWAAGRWVLAHVTSIKPLEGELGDDFTQHHARFGELADRDFGKLNVGQKIFNRSRYRLAADTAKELCLMYACVADVAPWQYGLEARLRARRIMRTLFLVGLSSWVIFLNVDIPDKHLNGWIGLTTFFAALCSFAGLYASSALYRMARYAKHLRTTPHE